MAFSQKGLTRIKSNVGTRATTASDIYIKSNTGANGSVTDPTVYQNAISMLQPYAGEPAVQLKMAEYANSAKALTAAATDQATTLAQFRQSLDGALFAKGDANRDPYTLARNTADLLNTALTSLDQNITTLKGQNKSTDTLVTYRQYLAQAAQQETDLVNGLANGTVNPEQDGYGYYVKTNPADGSLQGVALLPADVSNLTDTTKNMKRLATTANIGTGTATATVPVYMTSTTDSNGQSQAILGTVASGHQQVWNGASSSAQPLSGGDDTLDLTTSQAKQQYPFQQNTTLQPGQIGKVLTSVDSNGNPQYTTYYKAKDGSLNVITDPAALSALQSDPVLGKAASNPIDLSVDDVSAMGTSTPMSLKNLQGMVDNPAYSAPPPAPAAAPAQPGFFQTAEKDVGAVANAAGGVLNNVGGAISGFFSRKNRAPATPAQPSATVNGQPSAPDVVNAGQKFFQSAPSTLPPQTP